MKKLILITALFLIENNNCSEKKFTENINRQQIPVKNKLTPTKNPEKYNSIYPDSLFRKKSILDKLLEALRSKSKTANQFQLNNFKYTGNYYKFNCTITNKYNKKYTLNMNVPIIEEVLTDEYIQQLILPLLVVDSLLAQRLYK